MTVREAAFADVQRMAAILHAAARGKASPRSCRRRAGNCVAWARKARKGECLVAVAEDGSVRGWVFAGLCQAWDVCDRMAWLQVVFLLGPGCGLPLLAALRQRTRKRVLVPSWAALGNMEAFGRLLRPLHPRPVCRVWEI